MKYLERDLGVCKAGQVVKVILKGTEANVQLVDAANLSNYKARRSFKYVGGHYKVSPVILRIPRTAHWYAVIDLGGGVGQVKASVHLIN